MIIFAVDSSSASAGICVLKNQDILYETTVTLGKTHSETLLQLVSDAFAATALSPSEVNLFAITAGPGSFTGLRIGMALVKGLAFPGNTPAAGVSTLYAHALSCKAKGVIVPALNARRQEVYWSAYRWNSQGCQTIVPELASPVSELQSSLDLTKSPVFFVGDGAELCYNYYKDEKSIHCAIGISQHSLAYGAAVAALEMHKQGKTTPASNLVPNYLRLSQAERQRQEKIALMADTKT